MEYFKICYGACDHGGLVLLCGFLRSFLKLLFVKLFAPPEIHLTFSLDNSVLMTVDYKQC